MMNGALGLGLVLKGKDEASPTLSKVKKGLVELRHEGARARDAMGRFVTGSAQGMGQVANATSGATSAVHGFASQGSQGMGKFASATTQAGVKVNKLFDALQEGAAWGGAAFTAKGLLGLGAAWKVASDSGDFEASMSSLRAVSGATGDVLKGMRNAAIDAGSTMGVGPAEAADAIRSLSTAGFEAKDALDMLPVTLRMTQAAMGKMTSEQSGDLIAQSLNVFRLKASDAGAVADKLAKGADMMAVSLEDYQLGIANMSKGVDAMQANATDSIVAFGMVRAAGHRVETAGTAVAVGMQRMADPQVQRAIKGLGVDVVSNTGKFRSFLDVLVDMGPQLDKMTDAKRADFLLKTFGSEGMTGAAAILNQLKNGVAAVGGQRGPEALNALRNALDGSTGALANFAGIANDNLPGAMKKAEAGWLTLRTVMGEELGGMAKEALVGLSGAMKDATTWIRGLSPETKAIASKLLLVGSTIFAVTGSIAGLVGAAAMFKTAIIGGAVVMAPLIAAMTLATGVFFAFKYAVDRNIGGIADTFTKGSDGAGNFVERLAGYVERGKAFLSSLADGFEVGMGRAAPTLERLGTSLRRLTDLLGITSATVDGDTAIVTWGERGERVGRKLAGAFETVAAVLTRGIEFVEGYTRSYDAMGMVVEPLSGAFRELSGAVNDVMSAMGIAQSAGGGPGFWRGFGATVGFVASMFAGSLASAIQLVAGTINGIANVAGGMIQIVGGLIRGDWASMWHGAGRAVFGVLKIVSSVVLGIAEQFARLIDAAGKLGGKNLGLAKGLVEFRKTIENGAEGTLVGDAFDRTRVGVTGLVGDARDDFRAKPTGPASMGALRLAESGEASVGMGRLRMAESAAPMPALAKAAASVPSPAQSVVAAGPDRSAAAAQRQVDAADRNLTAAKMQLDAALAQERAALANSGGSDGGFLDG